MEEVAICTIPMNTPHPAIAPVAYETFQRLVAHLRARVFGRDNDADLSTIELIVCSLLSGGHVLLEDFPGSGKSYLAEVLGRSIQGSDSSEREVKLSDFMRIQCTADLLPSELTGYVDQHGTFHAGPAFTKILLVDEINRTTPKVQSALLEAMAERQITIENQTVPLGDLFFVIATQNPLDRIGTYPLTAAQLDRFLFKRILQPISQAEEAKVISMDDAEEHERLGGSGERPPEGAAVTEADILETREWIQANVRPHQHLVDCLTTIADRIQAGFGEGKVYRPSARSQKLLFNSLKAVALAKAIRNCSGPKPIVALPEHIEEVAEDFYLHRLGLNSGNMGPEVRETLLTIVKETVEFFKVK